MSKTGAEHPSAFASHSRPSPAPSLCRVELCLPTCRLCHSPCMAYGECVHAGGVVSLLSSALLHCAGSVAVRGSELESPSLPRRSAAAMRNECVVLCCCGSLPSCRLSPSLPPLHRLLPSASSSGVHCAVECSGVVHRSSLIAPWRCGEDFVDGGAPAAAAACQGGNSLTDTLTRCQTCIRTEKLGGQKGYWIRCCRLSHGMLLLASIPLSAPALCTPLLRHQPHSALFTTRP